MAPERPGAPAGLGEGAEVARDDEPDDALDRAAIHARRALLVCGLAGLGAVQGACASSQPCLSVVPMPRAAVELGPEPDAEAFDASDASPASEAGAGGPRATGPSAVRLPDPTPLLPALVGSTGSEPAAPREGLRRTRDGRRVYVIASPCLTVAERDRGAFEALAHDAEPGALAALGPAPASLASPPEPRADAVREALRAPTSAALVALGEGYERRALEGSAASASISSSPVDLRCAAHAYRLALARTVNEPDERRVEAGAALAYALRALGLAAEAAEVSAHALCAPLVAYAPRASLRAPLEGLAAEASCALLALAPEPSGLASPAVSEDAAREALATPAALAALARCARAAPGAEALAPQRAELWFELGLALAGEPYDDARLEAVLAVLERSARLLERHRDGGLYPRVLLALGEQRARGDWALRGAAREAFVALAEHAARPERPQGALLETAVAWLAALLDEAGDAPAEALACHALVEALVAPAASAPRPFSCAGLGRLVGTVDALRRGVAAGPYGPLASQPWSPRLFAALAAHARFDGRLLEAAAVETASLRWFPGDAAAADAALRVVEGYRASGDALGAARAQVRLARWFFAVLEANPALPTAAPLAARARTDLHAGALALSELAARAPQGSRGAGLRAELDAALAALEAVEPRAAAALRAGAPVAPLQGTRRR